MWCLQTWKFEATGARADPPQWEEINAEEFAYSYEPMVSQAFANYDKDGMASNSIHPAREFLWSLGSIMDVKYFLFDKNILLCMVQVIWQNANQVGLWL
jgi:hypothetical protein